MTRQLVSQGVSWALALGLAALLPACRACADELPIRKAGLWEMKVMRTGSPTPDMTMQHCTDETTDKDMSTAFAPMSKEIFSRKDVRKTATGFVSDSVCGLPGVSISSHSEIVGDFNSAYTVKTTSRGDGSPASLKGNHETTIEAKWLGACKPDQKPGDIVMPGGLKINIHDMGKLKLNGLLPKPKP
jgi:hypothetical protein